MWNFLNKSPKLGLGNHVAFYVYLCLILKRPPCFFKIKPSKYLLEVCRFSKETNFTEIQNYIRPFKKNLTWVYQLALSSVMCQSFELKVYLLHEYALLSLFRFLILFSFNILAATNTSSLAAVIIPPPFLQKLHSLVIIDYSVNILSINKLV